MRLRPFTYMSLALWLGAAAAVAEETALSLDDFAELHEALQPPEEAWRELPWHTSLLRACAQAAEEKKPVYMLCRSGHPLACV